MRRLSGCQSHSAALSHGKGHHDRGSCLSGWDEADVQRPAYKGAIVGLSGFPARGSCWGVIGSTLDDVRRFKIGLRLLQDVRILGPKKSSCIGLLNCFEPQA